MSIFVSICLFLLVSQLVENNVSISAAAETSGKHKQIYLTFNGIFSDIIFSCQGIVISYFLS